MHPHRFQTSAEPGKEHKWAHDHGETDDDQIENVDDAEELPVATSNNNNDDDIDFDDDDVDVDDDGPGIIQDAISEDDELLPNLDDKDEN